MSDKPEQEQSFTIQPHPATTNDPNTDPALNRGAAEEAFAAVSGGKPGPQIPSAETVSQLKTLSKEESEAKFKELNK
ncbi:hypothetical protein IE53DRAFT_369054 [Violaceomyces palustris]|uniref:Uncharacterized protein n=1 Tax=Violaceomyces palustris TaxID=1673888 RepID=A0ACD0NWS6_9BASI|nr:hypothetical protein IE53DRAFT_369054 [Violaceomyces palustris]